MGKAWNEVAVDADHSLALMMVLAARRSFISFAPMAATFFSSIWKT